MTRTMYDSVTVDAIPSGAAMVAGYVDGLYANIAQLKARFPHAVVVGIAVSSHTNAGNVLDVETGDATAQGAVAWVQMRRQAGADPSVYCNTSVFPSVVQAFKTAGVALPHFWLAHWDNAPTLINGAVAKQYANPSLTGHQYDLSVVADVWPGVDPTPVKPPPAPGPSYRHEPGYPVWSYRQPENATESAFDILVEIRNLVKRIAVKVGA